MINAGNIDNTLIINQGFDTTTSNTVTQPDGKIIIVGAFQFYRTLSYNRIVRINTDGTIDTTFVVGTGFNSEAIKILLQPDGKIIVAGGFTTYQGVSANRIIRLNSDGSRDTSFDIGIGFSSFILSIALQSDGKILVGGFFTEFQGVSANRIIRLNSDGSRDTTFDIGVGFNSTVRVINILPNGVIIIGGQFSEYKGLNYNRLIFLNPDGSIVTAFQIGTGFNSSVRTIKVLANGRIIIGGDFTSYQGITVNRIVQIFTQGTRDTSLIVGTGFNDSVFSIDVDDNNRVICVGNFTTYKGVTANRIIRLLSNGSIDTSFEGSFDNRAHDVIIQPNNKLLVCGGLFTEYNSDTANGLVRISSGELTYTVTPNPMDFGLVIHNSNQNKSIVLSNTSNSTIDFLYTNSNKFQFINPPASLTSGSSVTIVVKAETNVLGLFSETLTIRNGNNGDIITTNIEAKLNVVSNILIPSAEEICYPITDIIQPTCDGNDGSIVLFGSLNLFYSLELTDQLGNSFSATTSTTVTRFNNLPSGWYFLEMTAKNASSTLRGCNNKLTPNKTIEWIKVESLKEVNTFDIGTGFDGEVRTSATDLNGDIIVGGFFTQYRGVSNTNGIVKINPNGSRNIFFNTGTGFAGGGVISLVIQSDLKIICVGDFTSYDGNNCNHIVRLNLDGVLDTSFVFGNGFSGGSALTVAIQNDGKILVGGDFTSYDGNNCNRICRLNSDGTFDTSFIIGTGFNSTVWSIATQSDGKIICGGLFTQYNGNSYNRIVRLELNGDIDTTLDIGTGFNSAVLSVAIDSNNSIFATGFFTQYDGNSYNRVVKLNNNGTFDAAFDIGTGFNSTVLNIAPQSDGKLLIGGAFTSYNGVDANRIVRINTDGTRDTTFVVGTGFDNIVHSIIILPSNNIIVGGFFEEYDGLSSRKIISLGTDGSPNIQLPDLLGATFTTTDEEELPIEIVGSGSSTTNITVSYLSATVETSIYSSDRVLLGSFTGATASLSAFKPDTLYIFATDENGCTFLSLAIIRCLNNYSIGGIQKIYIGQWNNTFSANYDNREVMSFSNFNSTWYELPNNTINSFSQSYNKNDQGIYMSSNLSVTLQNDGTIDWEDMVFILDKKWVIVLKDNNDRYWVFGQYNGATSDVIGRSTGELNAGNNTFTIVFTDVNGESVLSSLNKNYVINNIV